MANRTGPRVLALVVRCRFPLVHTGFTSTSNHSSISSVPVSKRAIGKCYRWHRAVEFKKFLAVIDDMNRVFVGADHGVRTRYGAGRGETAGIKTSE